MFWKQWFSINLLNSGRGRLVRSLCVLCVLRPPWICPCQLCCKVDSLNHTHHHPQMFQAPSFRIRCLVKNTSYTVPHFKFFFFSMWNWQLDQYCNLGPDHDHPFIFCALSSLTQPCQLCRKVDQGSTKIQHNPQNCNSAMHWSALQPISNTYSSKYKLPRLFHLTFRDVDNSFRFSDSVQHNTCAALVLQVFIVCCVG